LDHPEYSVVCLYRRLVVGCAFISPDGYISYIDVHPEWRRSGIARFLLFHLIQSCPGKDITLHVSLTNLAMILYQKFAFKAEELILDFYEKYLPEGSKECRDAFFMRLRR
jgi:ribosomal protein S18 acetylase RimI-like enzyme